MGHGTWNQSRLGAWGECQGIGGARWKCLVTVWPCLKALESWNTRLWWLCCIFFHGGVDWQFLADEIHGLPSSGALPSEGVTTFKATRQRSFLESQPGRYVRVKALDIKSILAAQSQQQRVRVRPAFMGMHTWATSCGTTGSWDWLTSTWHRWVPLALCPGFVKFVAIIHAAREYSKWT